jgi:hypothetical protein
MNQSESRYNTVRTTGCDPVTGTCGSTKYSFSGVGNSSIEEKQKERDAILLGQATCGGQDPSGVAGCIQSAYNQMGDCNMVGGNCNFNYLGIVDPSMNSGCVFERCGEFDALHFHTDPLSLDYGTFHVDTANPYSLFGVGGLVHLIVDVGLGHTVFSGGLPAW